MSVTQWRSDVGFSDRLQWVLKISQQYRKTHVKATASEASSEAKAREKSIFTTAKSYEDYTQTCESAYEDLREAAPVGPPEQAYNDDGAASGEPGINIGRYTNAIYYRSGLASTIYKAIDPRQSVLYASASSLMALKIAYPSAAPEPHNPEREVRLLKRAASTSVIAVVETFRHEGDKLVIVFPFMPHALDYLLKTRQLTQAQSKGCLRDLLTALAHVHSLGMIHRDVKPSNILLKSLDGPAYLADFGTAWSKDDPASEPAGSMITDVGTTCYRPPELLFGNTNYNRSLDLWAAGCVAAEVVDQNCGALFEAGDLGSELALIKSIFETLGTPNLQTWPEARELPDWGKMQFKTYPGRSWSEILPGASEEGRTLVASLVTYESSWRSIPEKVLEHPYFATT